MRKILALGVLSSLPWAAGAVEGMWTLDNLPRAALKAQYGFEPDAAFVDRLMHGSVRLANGCSGSFVSSDGLVLTNNHCVIGCLSGLSSATRDLVGQGFVARARGEELQCPDAELNRLERITDVTERISKATANLSGTAYQDAKNAEKARIESECGDARTVRCDVVELYQGGRQQLYRYRRFQDVRLVFAPEYDIGFFGGDPDNFQFPRYNLDAALLRAYEDGKPAKVEHWFAMSPAGVKNGDLTLVTGHPGSTERQLTVAQLERQRDLDLVESLLYFSELRGLLSRYSAEGAEQARQAQGDLPFVENSLKVYRGKLRALQSVSLLQRKREEEADLQRDASPADRAAWTQIAEAQLAYARLAQPYRYLEGGSAFMTRYFGFARTLVRAAEERAKPDAERLREFQEANAPRLTQRLFSSAPIYPEYEKLRLAWSLEKLRERLGPDDGAVKLVLARESPSALAARLVDGTRLGDVAERKRLWEGGATAIAESRDPFIELARAIDAPSRALRRQYENEVESVESRGQEAIARLRFARLGTGVYPDATFTLRLSYGEVRGWTERGREIAPFTTLAGLYGRATDSPPFRLAPRWIQRKPRLDLATPFNFVSTNDIVGGNSGSPVLNRKGELVGLAFDGNVHALGGAYGFDEALNRTVSVDARAILEALRGVYEVPGLVAELRTGSGETPALPR